MKQINLIPFGNKKNFKYLTHRLNQDERREKCFLEQETEINQRKKK